VHLIDGRTQQSTLHFHGTLKAILKTIRELL